jgi:hypothetical protein
MSDPLTDPRLRVAPESLRGEQPAAPIYSALRSSWFRRAGADPEADAAAWSSPADEGWRQVAEVTRRAESINESLTGSLGSPSASPSRGAGRAFAGGRQGSALPRNGTAPAPEVRRATGPLPFADSPAGPAGDGRSGAGAGRTADVDTPAPLDPAAPAPAPAASAPTAPDREAEPALTEAGLPVRQRGASLVPGAIAAARGTEGPRDAAAVRSTLSTLVTGVARGRDARPEAGRDAGHDDLPQDRTEGNDS